MGVVYEAHDHALEQRVALKMIQRDKASGVAARRFAREARILIELGLPGVVRFHDAGEWQNELFLVMEMLDGEPFDRRIERRAPMAVDEAAHAICQLLATLDAVHGAGLLHRDIKPANVFWTAVGGVPLVKLLDFGLGRSKDPRQMSVLTAPGRVVGTPHYMAPSLLEGNTATVATDVYAVGVMLYEALAGVLPFRVEQDDPAAVMVRVLVEPRVPLRELRPDIPSAVADVVDYAAQRGDGFLSAAAMLRALDEATGLRFHGSPASRLLGL